MAPHRAAADEREEAGKQNALMHDAGFAGPLGERVAIGVGLSAQQSLLLGCVGIIRRRRLIPGWRLRQGFSRRLTAGRHCCRIILLAAEQIIEAQGFADAC